VQKVPPQPILFKEIQEGKTCPLMSLPDFFCWFLIWLRISFMIHRFPWKGIEIKTIVHSLITTSLIQQILDVVDVGTNSDHRIAPETLQVGQDVAVTDPMTSFGRRTRDEPVSGALGIGR